MCIAPFGEFLTTIGYPQAVLSATRSLPDRIHGPTALLAAFVALSLFVSDQRSAQNEVRVSQHGGSFNYCKWLVLDEVWRALLRFGHPCTMF